MRLADALRAWLPARVRALPPAEHEQVMARARIERYGGLTALYLSGTPYEMGYQQGALAQELIRGFRQAAYAYVTGQLPVPRALARPLLFHHASSYRPTLWAEHLLEMRASPMLPGASHRGFGQCRHLGDYACVGLLRVCCRGAGHSRRFAAPRLQL